MCYYLNNSVNYISSNYDYEKYQKKLDKILLIECSTNYKVAMLASFFVSEFPKLPYFWGGGHEATSYNYFIGINPNWGKMQKIVFDGDNDYKVGKEFPFSLDCSGFITWCLINSGFNISSYVKKGVYCLDSDDCLKMGQLFEITDNNLLKIIKVGDIAWMNGHVGIVIYVDNSSNSIDIVHISGSGKGLNLTCMSLENGTIIKDVLGPMPDGVKISRIGDKYFTHIISIYY